MLCPLWLKLCITREWTIQVPVWGTVQPNNSHHNCHLILFLEKAMLQPITFWSGLEGKISFISHLVHTEKELWVKKVAISTLKVCKMYLIRFWRWKAMPWEHIPINLNVCRDKSSPDHVSVNLSKKVPYKVYTLLTFSARKKGEVRNKGRQGERKLFRMMHTSHVWFLYYTAGQYAAGERWELEGI